MYEREKTRHTGHRGSERTPLRNAARVLLWVGFCLAQSYVVPAAEIQINDDYNNRALLLLAQLPGAHGAIILEESKTRAVYMAPFGKGSFYKITAGAGVFDTARAGWTRLSLTPPEGLSPEGVETAWRKVEKSPTHRWNEVYSRYRKGEVMLSVHSRRPFGENPRTGANEMVRRLGRFVKLAEENGLFFACSGKMVEPYDWAIGASVADGFNAEARALKSKVKEWRTMGAGIDAVSFGEIEAQIPLANKIADANGLDSERLGKIYALSKRIVTEGVFRDTSDPKPRDLSSLSDPEWEYQMRDRYERELAAWEERRKAYRLRLLKRMTVAYLDALLSSREVLPACCIPEPVTETMTMGGAQVPKLGCPDPVVDKLVAYGNAISQIASAEDERQLEDYELLVQQQQFVADVLAVIPLVGDAIDLYSLYAAEDLTGHCLSRFEKGLIVLLVALPIPYSAPQMAREAGDYLRAFARSPRVTRALPKIAAFLDAASTWRPKLAEGVARRWNVPKRQIEDLEELLKEIPKDVERMPIADVDAALRQTFRERGFEPNLSGLSEEAKRAKLIARWKQDATISKTLRDAAENRIWIRQMPKELRDRALRRSNAIMRHNLWARQPERREVIRLSNIVEEHLDEFEKVAKARHEIYVFRSVNPDAKRLIREHFATKDMHIKGKSSDWGPHAGFIPVDQKFSKLGNPERIARAEEAGELTKIAEELDEFYKKMNDCFAAGDCHEAPVRFEDGSRVVIIPADPAAGRARDLPVLEKDGKLLHRKVDPEDPKRFIDEEIHLSRDQADQVKPMMVVADKNGVPITADYDFLAFGMEGRHSSPTFDPDKGFIEKQQWKALDKINAAAERAGYEGGRIAHHGAENWFPFSPGAMTVDPYVTVVGPEGLTHIPRCNAECMQRWCDTTHLCGGLSICIDNPPRNPPCFPVDPDRLLKDYFHSDRLRGWNLDPNSKWGWGDYNVIGGWNAQNFLKQGEQGGWRLGSLSEIHPAVARMARRAMVTGIEGLKGGMEYLFECRTPEAGEEAGG